MRLASFLFRLVMPAALAVGVFVACADQQNPAFVRVPDNATEEDAGEPEDPPDAKTKKAAPPEEAGEPDDASAGPSDAGITGKCSDKFGDQLPNGFQRFDGLVYAVQKPSDLGCKLPNDDHVIIQVLMGGVVYRMVVNVQSDRDGSDPKVRHAAYVHSLPPPAFAEGAHSGVELDYWQTLGVHDDIFSPYTLDQLVAKIATAVQAGEKVSIYATAESSYHDSAHLVHRNFGHRDGAIVIRPDTATPTFLLFHFDEQSF